jgi:hypothetical protein
MWRSATWSGSGRSGSADAANRRATEIAAAPDDRTGIAVGAGTIRARTVGSWTIGSRAKAPRTIGTWTIAGGACARGARPRGACTETACAESACIICRALNGRGDLRKRAGDRNRAGQQYECARLEYFHNCFDFLRQRPVRTAEYYLVSAGRPMLNVGRSPNVNVFCACRTASAPEPGEGSCDGQKTRKPSETAVSALDPTRSSE